MSRFNGKRAEFEASGEKINVAILGAGRIARTMADTLTQMAEDSLYSSWIHPYAVAARDITRAQAFADQWHFDKAYGSYEELVADPDVDLVYIATPHSLHAEQAILCMKAGKNVLVEKSFTANAGQAREALAVAEETGMLCTEAIWTRYMPSRKLINEAIESGEIGEVKAASANLCYPVSGKARMTDPACAGGALLDVGVYPLNFLDMAVGAGHGRTLDHFDTSMVPAETGVDAQNSTTCITTTARWPCPPVQCWFPPTAAAMCGAPRVIWWSPISTIPSPSTSMTTPTSPCAALRCRRS